MENIDFWVDFVAENSNKLQKLGLEGKKSVEPSMCSHCRIFKISIMKMWIIKNVITPRPTAQGTLVSNNNKKSLLFSFPKGLFSLVVVFHC